MRVQTSIVIARPAAALWPLLCSSTMDRHVPWHFRLGIPKPVQCRLPDGSGGVGARRQCISNSGVVHQRITHWKEPELLRFQMEETTLYFRPCVAAMTEEFTLVPLDDRRTRLTRTTDITVVGTGRPMKELIFRIGVKCVHRYVFGNWARDAGAS